ncbi:hypothetical protein GCM10020219_094990 [Nonomuraea dietziae]
MSCTAAATLVPVEPPTSRPVTSRTQRIAAIEAASGTWIILSITPGRNEGSTLGLPMPSMREPGAPTSSPVVHDG